MPTKLERIMSERGFVRELRGKGRYVSGDGLVIKCIQISNSIYGKEFCEIGFSIEIRNDADADDPARSLIVLQGGVFQGGLLLGDSSVADRFLKVDIPAIVSAIDTLVVPWLWERGDCGGLSAYLEVCVSSNCAYHDAVPREEGELEFSAFGYRYTGRQPRAPDRYWKWLGQLYAELGKFELSRARYKMYLEIIRPQCERSGGQVRDMLISDIRSVEMAISALPRE